MHMISVYQNGEIYGVQCSCGWDQYGYHSDLAAWGVGYAHKQIAEEEKPDNYPDDPHAGY